MISVCQTCGNDLVSKDVGPIIVCSIFRNIKWNGYQVKLSPMGFKIVHALLEKAGHPIGFRKLKEAVFSPMTSDDAVRVHINSIRKAFLKVDNEFDRICHVNTIGYVWKTEDQS